jgi:hypothetical protein
MATETNVVVATQLNRVEKVDGADEFSSLSRGSEFTADDVTPAELRRWKGLKPRVILTKDEYEKATSGTSDRQEEIDDLQRQLADAQAELDALRAGQPAGVAAVEEVRTGGDGGPVLEEPAGNASAEDWRAYATQQDPDSAAEIAEMSRDDLRDTYKSGS